MAFKAPIKVQGPEQWKSVGFKDQTLWPLNPEANTQQGPLGSGGVAPPGKLELTKHRKKLPVEKTPPEVAKTAQLEHLVDMLIQKRANLFSLGRSALEAGKELFRSVFKPNTSQQPTGSAVKPPPASGSTGGSNLGTGTKPTPQPPALESQPKPSADADTAPNQPSTEQAPQEVRLYVPEAPARTDYLGAIVTGQKPGDDDKFHRDFYFEPHVARELMERIKTLQQQGLGQFGSLLVGRLIRVGDLADEYEQAKETGDPATIRKTYGRLRGAQRAALHEVQRLERAATYAQRVGGQDQQAPIKDRQDLLTYLTASNISDRARTRISGRNMLLEKDDDRLREEITTMLRRYGYEYGRPLDPDEVEQLTDRVWNTLQQDKRFQEERKRYEQEKASRPPETPPEPMSKVRIKPVSRPPTDPWYGLLDERGRIIR